MPRPEPRGATLPVVIAALVVGALSAAGVAAVARGARHEARGAVAALRARAAADAALARLVARWPARLANVLGPGARGERAVTTAAGPATVAVVRLDARHFALEAHAEAASGVLDGVAAARRHAQLVRLRYVRLAPAAAVVAGGQVTLAGGAEVAGGAYEPPGWTDCPWPAPPGVPHVIDAAVAAPALVLDSGAVVAGLVRHDSAAWAGQVDSLFGDVRYAELAAAADARMWMPPGARVERSPAPRALPGGALALGDEPCALDDASWGDPWRGAGAVAACAGAFPVVHAGGPGVLRLRGPARLQGTVLVDGDLEVTGVVEVAGALIVRGDVRAGGATLHLAGAIVAGGAVELGSDARVRASPCALEHAAAYAGRGVPLARRGWSEVHR